MKTGFYSFAIIFFCLAGQVFGQTPKQLYDDLPAVNGWDLSPDIEIFNRDNLYERINGAAPLFFENNFQEMTSMVYTNDDHYITVQAYRHAAPEDAFGMYASERSSDMTYYEGIGGEAQGDGYGLFFFAGSIYVKMSADSEGENISAVLLEIAKGFAAKIDPKANYPVLFKTFPKEGLIPCTESYITRNYIGHEFLKPVYTADYHIDGKNFQAFVVDAQTAENARKMLEEYFSFTGQQDPFVEGELLIRDRYNGIIPIVWKDRYIVGAFNEEGENFSENIYSFLNKFKL
ncbi:MAG: hypothetical protein LBH32_04285 [Dysgonamonadaceae bacterium]|jgi:hypothetical protein|nr:hypothetical protein [Dysgonamonadaceae bacterium]